VSGCQSEVLTAQDRNAVHAGLPAHLAQMSERELLVEVLTRLNALESRLEGRVPAGGGLLASVGAAKGGSNGQGTGVPASGQGNPQDQGTGGTPAGQGTGTGATPPGQGTLPGSGSGNGQGPGPLTPPPGVPHQLELIREQLDSLSGTVDGLNEKLNDITVGIGLPKPPDMTASSSDLFQKSAKLCFNIGAGVDTKLTGKGKIENVVKGGAGIDFYGNKMLIDLGGRGEMVGEITASPIKAGVNWTACVNAGRAEATAMINALKINAQEFESLMPGYADQVGVLKASPFNIINPNFKVFGRAEGGYPSASEMLSRLDNFFALVKGPICNRVKNKFDIVTQLGLGSGPLGGITSPAVDKLQQRFTDDC
jgi:hypothetical protein